MAQNNLETGAQFYIADFSLEDPANEENINRIIRWSTRESMVSISPASISSHKFPKAAYLHSGESDDSSQELVGYGAITHIYSSNVLELGGLVVSEKFRGRGIASGLVRAIAQSTMEAMDPELLITFSNPTSSSIFSRLGGNQIEDARTLPPEVWKVCHLCRFYDDAIAMGNRCCGRVFDITSITDPEQQTIAPED